MGVDDEGCGRCCDQLGPDGDGLFERIEGGHFGMDWSRGGVEGLFLG